MKKRYEVTLTLIYNHSVIVEADSREEAENYVMDNMEELAPDKNFEKGEKTVDYAERIDC